ncbi:MAG: lipoate--protein ligase [Halanaerobiales bacterium]
MDQVKKIKVVHSLGYNPWYNLALEEKMLNNIGRGEVILYLWQNEHTVVIGRNQNAWKECRCRKLEDEDGGYLARRLSGGGAVFHDLGNLNFTFIMDRELYDLDQQLEVILEAVKRTGIDARFSGRNDLIADGRKFSGNAFYFTTQSAYHHGTILLDTDFSHMLDYLQVSEDKIKSKGVDSVRSRVVNLRELKPELKLDTIKTYLKESFHQIYGPQLEIEEEKYKPANRDDLKEIYEKYSSWDWRYGRSPDFDIELKNRFDWGGIEIGLTLQEGVIKDINIYSDAMDVELIDDIKEILKGTFFRREDIIEKAAKLREKESNFKYTDNVDYSRNKIVNDLQQWFAEKEI